MVKISVATNKQITKGIFPNNLNVGFDVPFNKGSWKSAESQIKSTLEDR